MMEGLFMFEVKIFLERMYGSDMRE